MTDACTPQTVRGDDGAALTACPHGGHVLGWVPAGGDERLWLSPTTRCGPGSAIRGGIPVIFPQFAARGPLPKHGVARDRAWTVAPAPSDGRGVARWSAVLVDDAATREVWPQRFRLALTASAAGDRLDVRLDVEHTGREGDPPWTFTAALHSYLAVSAGARLHGLEGRDAEDNAAGGRALLLPADPLEALAPRDVAVPGVRDVRLEDPQLGDLRLAAEGFGDRVVWNPGPGHGLADVPEGGEAGFVCVEAAALAPVTLRPGEVWTGRETLSV